MLDSYMHLVLERAKPGACRWGDKTPHHMGYLHHIIQCYPNAKFVYTYRDSRSVVNSLSRPLFSPAPNNRFQNASTVQHYLSVYEREKSLVPTGSICEVRYEDLVADPEGNLRDLCVFLGLDYTPALLEEADKRTRDVVGWPQYKAWGKIEMQASQNVAESERLLEAYLYPWLIQQGYETPSLRLRPILSAMAWLRVLPYTLLRSAFSLAWRRQYPGFPFLVLRLPYIQ